MANQIEKVSFFTPVISEDYPLIKVVDYYLWFGGRVAEHVQPDQRVNGSHPCTRESERSNWLATTLKILTMIASLGLLPLLALAIKAIIRCCHKFHYQNPGVDLPPNPRFHLGVLLEDDDRPRVRASYFSEMANHPDEYSSDEEVSDDEVWESSPGDLHIGHSSASSSVAPPPLLPRPAAAPAAFAWPVIPLGGVLPPLLQPTAHVGPPGGLLIPMNPPTELPFGETSGEPREHSPSYEAPLRDHWGAADWRL